MPEQPNVLRHTPPRRLKLYGVVAVVVAAVVVVAGVLSRASANQTLTTWTSDQAIPTVRVISLNGSAQGDLVLPGDVEAFNTAPIHARVPGYLKRWYADIGAPVKAEIGRAHD